MEAEDSSGIAFFEFLVDGVLLSIICVFGIIGNVFVLFILSYDRMKSSINCYLQHLAVYDLLFLICKIFLHVIHVFSHHHNNIILRMYKTICVAPSPFVVGVTYTVRTGSIWTTVGVSVERYIAVCHPLKAIAFCSFKKTVLFNFIIAFLVISFNVPRFFEYETIQHFDNISNQTSDFLIKTSFGRSYFFLQVYNWMDIMLNNVFPFLALLFLNLSIYRVIRKARSARQRMTLKQKTDAKLSTMLFCIVAIFFICYTPSLLFVVSVITGFADHLYEYLPFVLHLTEAINSSVNFIVYCAVGKNFRTTVRRVFWTRRFSKKSERDENTRIFTLSRSVAEASDTVDAVSPEMKSVCAKPVIHDSR